MVKFKEIADQKRDEVTNNKDENQLLQAQKFYGTFCSLIKLSEAYYIAAECCTDPVKAREYLNMIRAARNIRNVPDDADLMTYVEKEYRKEFIGEGQLFWMYKRQNKTQIPSGKTVGEMIEMEKSFYLFNIPQDEMDQRKEANN